MNIYADIFDNFYPFIVIIFFIISILSSIMKKKMKESVQQNKTNYDDTEEYEIRHEEQEKPQYDYYKTTSGSYNVENILNKLQDKISDIEKQKKEQKLVKKKHIEDTQKKPKNIFENSIIPENKPLILETDEKKTELRGFERINDLPFLQKAIIFSEVFGKPKGLE